MSAVALHGGPDALGVPRWDFSTNANACGPAPSVVEAVREADATRYPDPACVALRERLGAFHGVAPERIVIAASASEFIVRMTAAVSRRWPQASVHVPPVGYADYARAAEAFGLRRVAQAGDASLVWHAEPGSPQGRSQRAPTTRDEAVLVVDAAYEPLRLEGHASASPVHAWRLMSPNKALGLTGVRGAYAIAPPDAGSLQNLLDELAPSWPIGAHGVVMLTAWAEPSTQAWLQTSLQCLRDWKQQQLACCEEMGWACEASVTPFYVARGPDAEALLRLREQGVKLRDAASLGLPGSVRLSVQPPAAQQALLAAWNAVRV